MNPANNSLLCLGLDPDPDKLPKHYNIRDAGDVRWFCHSMVDATHDIVGAYKINSAFFEVFGAQGQVILAELVRYIRNKGVPTILDAKRCDVENSARLYAKAAYDELGVDSMTVLPYFGTQALAAFDRPDKTTFVVAASTNEGAELLQGEYLGLVHEAHRLYPNMGFVAPAPRNSLDRRLQFIRSAAKDAWLLVPGIGAQAGDLLLTCRMAQIQNGKTLIAVSRDILYTSSGKDYKEAARVRALNYSTRINNVRQALIEESFSAGL